MAPKSKHKTKAPCIAILGTGSDVGKSIVTTALCRLFSNQGIRVAPYKSQNMSNNSGVTPEGLEMGRAQIVQAEDSVVIEQPKQVLENPGSEPAVGVIRLPHISNFNDFDPLSALDGLTVCFLEKIQDLAHFKAVILPGSKNTRFDLNWLHTAGWSELIKEYGAQGGHVLGICGGYQMMGNYVHDPDGLEGTPGKTDGLRLLPVETYLIAPKTTTLTRFSRQGLYGSGYEIHMGHTSRAGGLPLFQVKERNSQPCEDEEGCIAPESGNMGTYIHGLFENPAIMDFWLQHIDLENLPTSDLGGLEARNREYELLVEHFEKHIDVRGIVATLTKWS